MYFANIRALKVDTAKVLSLSAKRGPVIITRRGRPIAVLRALDPEEAWREFDGLWSRLRAAATRAGFGRKDADRIIREVRAGR